MKVQYIGQKAKKYDNVTLSSFTWTPGQVLDVPDDLGSTLVKYTDVWSEFHEKVHAETEAKAGGRKAPPVLTRPA